MERALRKATERLGCKEMKPEQVKEFTLVEMSLVFYQQVLAKVYVMAACRWCSMNYLGRRINR